MKREKLRILKWLLVIYSIPLVYYDTGNLLAMYAGYYLPFITNSATNEFQALLVRAVLHIVISIPVIIGLLYLNKQWKRLKVMRSHKPSTG